MDTDQLIAHSRARFEHEAARRTLREKYQAKLTFAHAGGMWQAGPELINILTASLTHGQQGLILLDMYETPVMVDYKELLKLAQQRWQEQMTGWLVEYTELNKNR
jgi:hypothetical protein